MATTMVLTKGTLTREETNKKYTIPPLQIGLVEAVLEAATTSDTGERKDRFSPLTEALLWEIAWRANWAGGHKTNISAIEEQNLRHLGEIASWLSNRLTAENNNPPEGTPDEN